uniref:uncharacterized protein n=1 Tax=Myxine glutinosa TaxID=7769 RepID=UPI00358EC0F9
MVQIYFQVTEVISKAEIPKPNISQTEKKAVTRLQQDASVHIVTADKGIMSVIMDREEYDAKIQHFLNIDTSKKHSRDPMPAMKRMKPASRRVKFVLEDGVRNDLCDSSQQSFADSGLGDPEAQQLATHSTSSGISATFKGPGSQLTAPLLSDSRYERTTPDGCTGESEHPESAPIASTMPAAASLVSDLPDVALSTAAPTPPTSCGAIPSTCTTECQMYGHSDNCWMPQGDRAPNDSSPLGFSHPEWDRRDLVPNGAVSTQSPTAAPADSVEPSVSPCSNVNSPTASVCKLGSASNAAGSTSRQANSYYNAFYSNNYRHHGDFLNETEATTLGPRSQHFRQTPHPLGSPDYNKELYL